MLRYALLALLLGRERHGYDLKAAFEELLGGAWDLNVGQVYTTLARLERDGLVTHRLVAQETYPDRKTYTLTPEGQETVLEWLREPAEEIVRLKDTSVLKVVLHGLVGAGDPLALVWAQRDRCLEALADLSEARDRTDTSPATRLVLEAAMAHVEADLRWLNLVEERTSELAMGPDQIRAGTGSALPWGPSKAPAGPGWC